MNLTISVDSSRKPGGQHAQGNLAANIKCLNIIFFKIENNSFEDISRELEIGRAECAKFNDRVSRRFMLMHTVGSSI